MKNPIQPLVEDANGVLRFKDNAIVRHLLDTHPACDMNRLAAWNFTDDDRQQFAQLIGYSLSGYGELSYVSDEACSTAEHMADGLDERDARIAALEQIELHNEAADELESLARLMDELVAWQAEGETLLEKPGLSSAFSLGRWWADRPWRERPKRAAEGGPLQRPVVRL
jgi:hypothetical protein